MDGWNKNYSGKYVCETHHGIFKATLPFLGWTGAKYGLPFIPLGLFPINGHNFDSTKYTRFELMLETVADKDSIIIDVRRVKAILAVGDTIPGVNDDMGPGLIRGDGKWFNISTFYFNIPFNRTKAFTVDFGEAIIGKKYFQVPPLEIERDNYTVWEPIIIPTN
jgi:hypothetical protein